MKRKIAIVGASSDRAKFGNKCVRAYSAEGWEVFPVNPSGEEIEGRATYRSLREVPGELERISLYLPPEVSRGLLPDIANRGAEEVWFNPGSADPETLAAAREFGIAVRDGCSIRDIGRSPSEFT